MCGSITRRRAALNLPAAEVTSVARGLLIFAIVAAVVAAVAWGWWPFGEQPLRAEEVALELKDAQARGELLRTRWEAGGGTKGLGFAYVVNDAAFAHLAEKLKGDPTPELLRLVHAEVVGFSSRLDRVESELKKRGR